MNVENPGFPIEGILQNMKINCCLDSTGQNTLRSGSLSNVGLGKLDEAEIQTLKKNDYGALFATIILVPFRESSPNQVTPSWINIACVV